MRNHKFQLGWAFRRASLISMDHTSPTGQDNHEERKQSLTSSTLFTVLFLKDVYDLVAHFSIYSTSASINIECCDDGIT